MCIAIIKNAGVDLPNSQILKRCWRKNDDGAGYAYLTTENEWHVVKGLMTWDAFINSYMAQEFKIGHTVLLHFRVGTSGKKVKGDCFSGCTHPFPVAAQYKRLMDERYTTKQIVIHNGVHSRPAGDLSDSQLAVKNIVYPLMPYLDDERITDMLARLMWGVYEKTPNRWLICDGEEMFKLGNWITDKETGLIYSNDGYKPSVKKWEEYSVQRQASQSWLAGTASTTKGQVVMKPGHEAYEFCAGGHWSWDKWDKEEGVVEAEVMDKPVDDDMPDGIEGVYDENGNTIGLVDKEGNVVWNDELEELEAVKEAVAEAVFECNECGAELFISQCNGGMCPWCYAVIDPAGALGETEECPNCSEKAHLMDSTFDRGDRECLRCGALFMNTIPGPEGIVGWNPETKEHHDHLVSIIAGGGAF